MQIETQIGPASTWRADALVLAAFEAAAGERPPFVAGLNAALPWLALCPAVDDFSGRAKQVMVAYGPRSWSIPRAILVGLGKFEQWDLDRWREALSAAFKTARELKIERLALAFPLFQGLPATPAAALDEGLAAGSLALYRYREHQTRDRDEAETGRQPTLVLCGEAPLEPADAEALRDLPAEVAGVELARDLVSGPSNQVTPSYLRARAQDLADTYGFRLEVIDREQAEALGMGAFAAVARGSREPACCIILEYAPSARAADPPLVLVGKGITFDSGGISLKPSAKLEAMKMDMAGAAAVLGTFHVIGRLRPDRRIIGIMPCTENMPDGKAYKPGDIIRSLSGQTIEVISTDAEGRMILCDALTYALRFEPAAIIDLATLTGACVVALGERVAGVMGNRDDLVKQVAELGSAVGEKFWPLPLWDFYFEDLKSDAADFKNVGERKAGSIIGGVFLKQFVPDRIPWVHLDIAGPAWTDRELPGIPKGASGFGVRTLWRLIRQSLTDAPLNRS
ncbi:MAG: hypothetical protein AUK55_04530 [Syntrophobacteraceae bacterium CG2_30_61_12]|nr:MAG: hypothetical protein AUK55_04530 [Syntrophobacteraceae bacterium CG2_30_61_12]